MSDQIGSKEIRSKNKVVGDALAIFGLFNLAVVRPLFELLGQNPEFFVFKRTSQLEMLGFILIWSILFPSVLVLAKNIISRISKTGGKLFYGLLIAILTLAFILPSLNRQEWAAGYTLMAVLVLICLGTSAGYFHFHWLRLFYVFLAPAAVIVPLLFIFSPHIWQLIFSKPVEIPQVDVRSETPIILVVFDEFPVLSIMDENRNVDAKLYPNFSRLASEWNWYRNASTVAERTEESLPGILTGRYPKAERLPVTINYPQNLFTLFAKSYHLKVSETITWMNPQIISFDRSKGLFQGLQSLFSDLGLVYFHIVIPSKYLANLPPVTQSWGDFNAASGKGTTERQTNFRNPVAHLRSFLNSIQSNQNKTLYFLHVQLPHSPWYLLPSGKEYGARTYDGVILRREQWQDDEAAVKRGYYRHLLQIGYIDRWIGELIKQLQNSRLYDESIIVLTADHGISFTPGQTWRSITKENAEEIMFVPLFIKSPGQKTGRILDWNAETIDILPTITELAGVKIPWKVDGVSVANNPPPKDRIRLICPKKCKATLQFDPSFRPGGPALERKLAWFGSGVDAVRLNRISNCSEIIGKPAPEDSETAEEIFVKLRNKEMFTDVSLQSEFLPIFVAGTIRGQSLPTKQITIGVSVNGFFQASTLSSQLDQRSHHFDVLIPETSLREGRNNVRLYNIPTCDAAPLLIQEE